MKNRLLKLISALSAAMLLLCGCSWSSDKQNEVIKTPLEQLLLGESIIHSGDLKSSDGSVIATYYASFPQFIDTGSASQTINSSFALLAEDSPGDMESFFNHIKTQLGEGWETKTFDEPFHTIKLEYSLVPTLSDYVCFVSEYTITENGIEKVYPGVNMFLSSTGWSLNFETLFGENTQAATELLISQLNSWCVNHKIPSDVLKTVGTKTLNGTFGITETQVFVCFDPYFFSTQHGESLIIYLPLAPFKSLLIEQSHK